MMLRVKDLGKGFVYGNVGFRWVFRHVNLFVDKREILSVIGPSGCGKTTLLKIIAGLDKPTEGKIEIKPEGLFFSSLVSDDYGLLPWLTVEENLLIAVESYYGEAKREVVYEYLDLFGLSGYEHAYPSELSKGTEKKVLIARALIVKPSLLLMDEPFSNLDPLSYRALREELLKMWHDEEFGIKTIVMATHNIEDAVYMSDKIAVMGKGESEEASTIKKVIEINIPRPRDERSEEFQKVVDSVYTEFSKVV